MKVISEFIDRATGKRVLPGADFTPHDDAQRARLVRAGCLENTPAPKEETPHTFAVSSDQVEPSATSGKRGRKRSGRGKGSAS